MKIMRSATIRYTIYGALFGLLFPIMSTLWKLLEQQLPLTLESLLSVRSSDPLLYVIDTAPLFLGLFASLAGRRQAQVACLNDQLVQESAQVTNQLQALQEDFENRVAERTQHLERRSLQLQSAADVGRAITSIRDQDTLLSQVTYLIGKRFGFYHVGIFLQDEAGEYAVLRAANSQGGQQMLAQGHKLKVEDEGIIGHVIRTGKARIAPDVEKNTAHLQNRLLPHTRSEMALPLRVGDQLLGALDIHSSQEDAFAGENVQVLQALADQVAIAIKNARLLAESQAALEAMRQAYGEVSHEAWARLARAGADLRYLCDSQGTTQLAASGQQPEMVQALQEGRTIHNGGLAVAIPVEIRGQVLGVVRLCKPDDLGEWTTEEVELMETLTDQLSLALEGARLYQDTQRRAEQERLIGEVTTRVRETLDIQTVLKTAAGEMRQALGLDRVVVRLATEETDDRSILR